MPYTSRFPGEKRRTHYTLHGLSTPALKVVSNNLVRCVWKHEKLTLRLARRTTALRTRTSLVAIQHSASMTSRTSAERDVTSEQVLVAYATMTHVCRLRDRLRLEQISHSL